MKAGIKATLGVFTLAVVIAITGAIYLFNFNPNNNKELIAAKFKEATGHDLSLDGEIGLTLYPWLGLTINDLNISNANGFSEKPMLHADQAAIRIKLLPLLSSKYEIDTVRLNGVQLRLEVAANNTNNWSDLAAPSSGKSEANSSRSGNGLNNLILGGVDIQNTNISYDNKSANTHYEINNLNMKIGELVYGKPLEVKLSLQAAASSPELRSELNLTGTVLYDLDNGVYQLDPLQLSATLNGPSVPGNSTKLILSSPLSLNTKEDTLTVPKLQFSALDSEINGELVISNLQSKAPSLKGNLKVQGNDLGILFSILEQNDLAARIRNLDSKFNLQASIDANMESGEVQIPTLQATLLGANIKGSLTATEANTDKPTLNGKLQAKGPDLPTLIEVFGILQTGSKSALAQTGRNLAGINNKNFSLQSDFSADLRNGNIQLPVLSANLLGFQIEGSLAAKDIQGGGGNVDGKLTIQSNTAGEVLSALGQGDIAKVTQSFALDVKVSGNGEKLRISPFKINLVVAGSQLGNTLQTLALNADTDVYLKNDKLNIEDFKLSGLDINLNGKLSVSNFSTSPKIEGDINLPSFNARQFMRQLNMKPLNTADAAALQQLSMAAEFNGTNNSFELSKLNIKVDDTTLTGNLMLSDLKSMNGNFDVNIDRINADRYLAPTSKTQTATASESAPLPVQDLRKLNFQGKLAINQLIINGLKLSNINVPLNASAGVVTLNPITAQLYEGSFSGNFALDASGQESVANVTSTLTTINLGSLTQDFMNANYLTGKGNIQLSLAGRGNDSNTIKHNLNGGGSMTIADGVLSGVDVGGALAAIETMIRSKSLVDLPRGGNTPFQNFSATLNIKDGAVSTNDLLIKAPGWQITGTGTLADLRRETIDFNLVTAVDASTATVAEQKFDIGGHQLPIACNGSLTSPRCLPDAKAIIASAVSSAVQKRLGNFLRDRLGGSEGATTPTNENEQQTPTEPTSKEQPSAEQQLLDKALQRFRR